ncbi:hypothetical protein GF412_03155 [Candidatus Micrarchaeota archaeon]|nr:hypothetical protein [Candidatus Micrarchaeota archaeon]MBD3417951.1 hypothetical protein [Candidatus Micrarchaeota archaeon]
MKNALFAIPVLLILFSGCLHLTTDEDCESITKEEVLQQTAWGESLVNTDESVVTKARVSCWNNAALAHAAKSNPVNATNACNQILLLAEDPGNPGSTLEREHVFCISSIAKRLRLPHICEEIGEGYEFEKNRCITSSTYEEPLCVLTSFSLLSLAFALFFRKKQD